MPRLLAIKCATETMTNSLDTLIAALLLVYAFSLQAPYAVALQSPLAQ